MLPGKGTGVLTSAPNAEKGFHKADGVALFFPTVEFSKQKRNPLVSSTSFFAVSFPRQSQTMSYRICGFRRVLTKQR